MMLSDISLRKWVLARISRPAYETFGLYIAIKKVIASFRMPRVYFTSQSNKLLSCHLWRDK